MFTPRSFDEILSDAIAYVQATTQISDFTVGSVVRTILEAAAIEDEEQYYQMVQLLDMYSFTIAAGDDLDRRLADFNLTRNAAKGSTVKARFFNSNLISSQISLDTTTGSTQASVFNVSSFPTPSPTYNIRIAEGTGRVQDVTVSGVNYSTGVLSLSTPTLYDIFLGDRVSYVGTDFFSIPMGTAVLAPATTAESAKTFTTQEPAYILPGNFYSNEIIAYSQNTGSVGNVGARRISQFGSSAPFPGAGVINLTAASGGLDRENDADFRARAVRHIQSLSRGTPLALTNAALGVVDSTTQQRVTSANIIEDFENDEVIVYIDDGTGLVPDVAQFASDSLQANASIGDTSIHINSSSNFPSSGTILILTPTGTTESVAFTANVLASNILVLGSPLGAAHTSGDIVLTLDMLSNSTELGQRRFRLQKAPVVRGTFRLFVNQGSLWQELVENVDFFLNKGTGDLQLSSTIILSAGSIVAGSYSYYTNLVAEVQKVLEGDISNPVVYPGYKAAGVILSVEAPNIRRINVVVSITAQEGFTESDLWDAVRQNIEAYINSLKIGEDVIRSKIIDVAFNVTGVFDVSITLPSSNVVILENELAVAFNASGETLVTVS